MLIICRRLVQDPPEHGSYYCGRWSDPNSMWFVTFARERRHATALADHDAAAMLLSRPEGDGFTYWTEDAF